VGKSFALNHFADTSFAYVLERRSRSTLKPPASGSAMRCTEGVWLSVTPTRDYVLVSMDFEGGTSLNFVIWLIHPV
jgi:hypothetical protein